LAGGTTLKNPEGEKDPVSRFKAISPESATGKAKHLLDTVNAKFGMVPNMMQAMANSPAVLDGYLNLSGSLAKGSLSAKTREQKLVTCGTIARPIQQLLRMQKRLLGP
jgi:hypothetical protein